MKSAWQYIVWTISLSAISAPPAFAATNALDQFCRSRDLLPLRQTAIPDGSFEARVWIFSLAPQECIRLRRDGFIWSAFVLRDGLGSNVLPQERRVHPRSGWTKFWDELQSQGLLTLHKSAASAQEISHYADGEGYLVEIMDGNRFHAYDYWNPQIQSSPEAAKMVAIMGILRHELIGPDEMPNQSMDPTP